jgi:hypothetical protein
MYYVLDKQHGFDNYVFDNLILWNFVINKFQCS